MISEPVRQTRDLVLPVVEAAAEPLGTTEIGFLIGGWQTNVYIALCSLERDGKVIRAGRVGGSARGEVLWARPGGTTEVS